MLFGIRIEELHPIIVHFPIALLLFGVVMDYLAAILRRWSLADTGTWLQGFGVVSLLVAGLSGAMSENHVPNIAAVASLVSLHKNVALLTGVVFALAFVIRIVRLAPRIVPPITAMVPPLRGANQTLRVMLPAIYAAPPGRWQIALFLLLDLVGAALLAYTGYLGGAIVYDHIAGPAHALIVGR
jgi:uncharacterized membrane protein